MHKHKCPNSNCAHIWQHSPKDFASSQEFLNGHSCPKCGAEQWEKHYDSRKEQLLETLEEMFGHLR